MTKNTRDIKEIIGGNITFLRKGKKWTQLELAEKMDYSDKAISKWERGESSPDPDALLALANLFDVQIDYFFHDVYQRTSRHYFALYLCIHHLCSCVCDCFIKRYQ